jgi:hypothetical protein
MRKFAKTTACNGQDNFAMWIIAGGVLIGAYLALAI